jgi:hypothetical protein
LDFPLFWASSANAKMPRSYKTQKTMVLSQSEGDKRDN